MSLTSLSDTQKYPQRITIFGSTQPRPHDEYYKKAVEVSSRLSRVGYAIVTGGGPGIMEAANRGAFEAGGPSIGFNIVLPKNNFSIVHHRPPGLSLFLHTKSHDGILCPWLCLFPGRIWRSTNCLRSSPSYRPRKCHGYRLYYSVKNTGQTRSFFGAPHARRRLYHRT